MYTSGQKCYPNEPREPLEERCVPRHVLLVTLSLSSSFSSSSTSCSSSSTFLLYFVSSTKSYEPSFDDEKNRGLQGCHVRVVRLR